MFGLTTLENMPQEYLTSHAAWDEYIGTIWLQMLRLADISLQATLIEIGPGASTKIAHALSRLGFKGRLHVVDAAPAVVEVLKPQYEALLPHAMIEYHITEIEDFSKSSLAHVDAILASHIVDDMLLYRAMGRESLSWAAAYTHAPAKNIHAAWSEIAKNAATVAEAQKSVQDTLIKLIEKTSPSTAIFNQYPSATLADHGMANLNDAAFTVFDNIRSHWDSANIPTADIQDILNNNKNYNNAHIGNHVLNAQYWMICKKD